jgi:hypothetical protein
LRRMEMKWNYVLWRRLFQFRRRENCDFETRKEDGIE